MLRRLLSDVYQQTVGEIVFISDEEVKTIRSGSPGLERGAYSGSFVVQRQHTLDILIDKLREEIGD